MFVFCKLRLFQATWVSIEDFIFALSTKNNLTSLQVFHSVALVSDQSYVFAYIIDKF